MKNLLTVIAVAVFTMSMQAINNTNPVKDKAPLVSSYYFADLNMSTIIADIQSKKRDYLMTGSFTVAKTPTATNDDMAKTVAMSFRNSKIVSKNGNTYIQVNAKAKRNDNNSKNELRIYVHQDKVNKGKIDEKNIKINWKTGNLEVVNKLANTSIIYQEDSILIVGTMQSNGYTIGVSLVIAKEKLAVITTLVTAPVAIATPTSTTEGCVDIKTSDITKYLNEKIKPRLDIKLDRKDGFLAINGTRQNLDLEDLKISPSVREWTYFFKDVRREGSNFWYDSKKNAFILDVKFEDDGIELKGRCEGCLTSRMKDDRAPDVNWKDPQILRFTLNPIVFQRSASFEVTEVEMIGDLIGRGFGDLIPMLTRAINNIVREELTRVFTTDVTKRLFNDAMIPLLKSKNSPTVNSISMASSSLRVCK